MPDYAKIYEYSMRGVFITLNVFHGILGGYFVYKGLVWHEQSFLVTFAAYFGLYQVILCSLGCVVATILYRKWMKKIYQIGLWSVFFGIAVLLCILYCRLHITMKSYETEMRLGMLVYKDSEGSRKIWDETQKGMKCCGIKSYLDWHLYGDLGSITVPHSCSQENLRNDPRRVKDFRRFRVAHYIFKNGCLEKKTEKIRMDFHAHSSICFVSAAETLFCIFLSHIVLKKNK